MSDNDKKIISPKELGIHFDDQLVYDLDQKLFNGEITLEEYKEAIDQVWIIFCFSLFLLF